MLLKDLQLLRTKSHARQIQHGSQAVISEVHLSPPSFALKGDFLRLLLDCSHALGTLRGTQFFEFVCEGVSVSE